MITGASGLGEEMVRQFVAAGYVNHKQGIFVSNDRDVMI